MNQEDKNNFDMKLHRPPASMKGKEIKSGPWSRQSQAAAFKALAAEFNS